MANFQLQHFSQRMWQRMWQSYTNYRTFFFPLLMSILSNNLDMCKVLKSISRMLIEGFGQATPLDLIISRMTEACNMKSWIESYTQGCGFEGFASNSSWSLVSGRRSWCDCHMESLFESYTQWCHRFEGCASKILLNLVSQRKWQLQHAEFNFKSKHKDLLILLLQVLKLENQLQSWLRVEVLKKSTPESM